MFTLAQAEKSMEWLMGSAQKLGHAKRRAVYAESMVKRMRAIVMKRYSHLPVSAAEREANASDELMEAYEVEADAAGEYETLRALKDAHIATIEGWRSMEASARAASKA
jgi:hypothetical protein